MGFYEVFMIQKIAADDRHFTNMGWLKTYWLFSFSDYYDPENVQHGMLRVFNDDVVAPHTGFGKHPHEEMEIISIVLEGEMVHQDTMGNHSVIKPGDVQRMTAGTGLYHSEQNTSDEPVHFYQIWIYPDKKGLAPSYDQKHFSAEQWHNRLKLLASGDGHDGVASLNSDGLLYRGSLEAGHSVSYTAGDSRILFLYIMAGHVNINGIRFDREDQARISGENSLQIHAATNAEMLLIDVPAT